MTDEIPSKPPMFEKEPRRLADIIEYQELVIAHEHAVAAALLDALVWKRLDDGTVQEHGTDGPDYHEGCHRCETLKRIEASGWRR